jgi:hypothetical protein
MVHDVRSAVSTVVLRSFAVLAMAWFALPMLAQTSDPAVAAQDALKPCQDAFVACANACQAAPATCAACESARAKCRADVKANVSAAPRGPAGSSTTQPGQGGSPKTPPGLPPEVTTCTAGSDGKPCVGDNDPCTYDLCKGLKCGGVRATVETTLSQQIFYITAEPKMPEIVANAKVVGVEPDPTAAAQFRWTFTISYTAPPPLSKTITEELTALGGARYTPTFQDIRGGKVTASATLVRGVSNCAAANNNAQIYGTNPPFTAVKAFIDSIDGMEGEHPYLARMACHESKGDLQFERTRKGWVGRPLVEKKNGGKFGKGVGIMQLTKPPARPDSYWNWQENIRQGIELYNEKVAMAEQRYKDLNKLKPPPPPLSEEQKLQDVMTLYNGGYYWRFLGGKWVAKPPLHPLGACEKKKSGDKVILDATKGTWDICASYYERVMREKPCE